jgi:hypothetical protein
VKTAEEEKEEVSTKSRGANHIIRRRSYVKTAEEEKEEDSKKSRGANLKESLLREDSRGEGRSQQEE